MNTTKLKIALIATTILSCGVLSGPAQAAINQEAQQASVSAASTEPTETPTPIDSPKNDEIVAEAPADTKIDFEKTQVKSVPAPAPAPEPEPEVIVEEAPVVAPPAPVVEPLPEPVAPAAPVVVEPSPAPKPAAPVVSSGKGATIASAALGQIGVMQDCTMLVTNSLKAVGINFHDWPIGYYSLGSAVSAAEAQPGDLIYYTYGVAGNPSSLAHIAVYIGNGQAVHGGWNGNQTKVHSVNVGSGPQFIRVR